MGMKDLIQEQLLQAGGVSSVMPEILRMDRCRRRWTGADGWWSSCRASLPSLLTPSPPYIGGRGIKREARYGTTTVCESSAGATRNKGAEGAEDRCG